LQVKTKNATELDVRGTIVRMVVHDGADYVCITDIAALKNPLEPKDVVKNWMRSRATIAFLGLWEKLHNPGFKGVDFDPLLAKAGDNAFTMSPTRWVEEFNAVGILCRIGRGGGTFAHRDIAFEFTSWVSPEFKLYLITEFERLKAKEQELLGWSAKRELAKINYRIHTDAIRENLVPAAVSRAQANAVYASEADVLNVALFGLTHQQWQATHPGLRGNQRDHAGVNQLICLSNLENLNAVMINDGVPQSRRLLKLNEIAIQQMRVLAEVGGRKLLREPGRADGKTTAGREGGGGGEKGGGGRMEG
jgi:hypothetical protein